jgi:lysozyme
MKPNVLDLYHGDNRDAVPDFHAISGAGIWAIIHKTSQGNAMVDKQYAPRRLAATSAGLLWGAYHFMDATDPIDQAKHFLSVAEPDANTLLACDYEKSSATPALHQCKDFMAYVDANAPGQTTCVLYSGDLIRETLQPPKGGHQNPAMLGAEMFFAQHRLWLAEYGPHANIPWPWSDKTISDMWRNPFLWQFSGSGRINPIIGAVDLNFYAGTKDQLAANWAQLQAPTPNPAAAASQTDNG